MDAAIGTLDEQTAYENWRKTQWDGQTGGSVMGDAPYIYLMNISHLYFVRDNPGIGNPKWYPHDHGFVVISNIMDWSWKKKAKKTQVSEQAAPQPPRGLVCLADRL